MKIVSKPVNFIKEVKLQLTKVSWPTKRELMGATSVVIVITGIIVVFIWLVDSSLSNILRWVFR